MREPFLSASVSWLTAHDTHFTIAAPNFPTKIVESQLIVAPELGPFMIDFLLLGDGAGNIQNSRRLFVAPEPSPLMMEHLLSGVCAGKYAYAYKRRL